MYYKPIQTVFFLKKLIRWNFNYTRSFKHGNYMYNVITNFHWVQDLYLLAINSDLLVPHHCHFNILLRCWHSQNSNNALFIQLSFVGIIKKILPCITNCNFSFRKVMRSKLTLKSWGHFLILVVMCFNQCLKKVRIPPTGTHPEV